MAEATKTTPDADPPSLTEAQSWTGFTLDDVYGIPVGLVRGAFVDSQSGEPAWLVVAIGRRGLLPLRRRAVLVAVPARDCAGAVGRVWCAHERRKVQTAPVVDPVRPLLREHEIAICAHYEIGPKVGRAAEVVGRPEAVVSAVPSAGRSKA